MKKEEATVLLYSFIDQEKMAQIRQVLGSLQIKVQVLASDSCRQKIGYLAGMKGFSAMPENDEDFIFPHEVMIFHNIKGKRLDQVLLAMKKADIAPVKFKAIVTPFNMFWTLRRLCETVQKEHAAMINKG